MIELKRHVERIVRPIRASGLRKTRMREELLSHLAHLYEEESAKHADDPPAALAATIERFGDPAILRAELQAAVPVVERWMFAELAGSKWGCRRPGESAWAHIRRTAPIVMGFNVVAWILLVAFIAMVGRGRPERASEVSLFGFVQFAAGYVLWFPIFVYGPVLICDRIRAELEKLRTQTARARHLSWLRVAAYAASIQAIFGGGFGVLMSLLNRAITIELITTTWFWGIVLA
jgi:hypothetical protein